MILLINKTLRYSLKITGFWPGSRNIVCPLVTVLSLVTTVPFQLWSAFSLLDDSVLLMDSLSDILSETLILIKFILMWSNKSQIVNLLRDIFKDWSNSRIPDEWKTLTYYSHMFCTIDMFLYLSAHVFYYPDLIKTYLTKPVESRRLFFQSNYPFDYRVSPIYEIVTCIQALQAVLMIIADSLSKTLLVTMILHVSGQIMVLNEYITVYSNNFKSLEEKRSTKNTADFKQILRQHLKIINLVRRIDSAYSYVALFQVVFSNLIICVTGFVIITAMKSANIKLMMSFIAFIIVMLSEALAFCFAGQYLRDKGETISRTLYDCLWYNTQSKDMKAIMFVLARSQAPLTLYGGKLFELSTNSFTMIIKTSASYLSVLRAVYT